MVVAYQKARVAVVGSGVSGLAATWALNEYSDAEVHLFEADNRPGGHTNTVGFKRPNQAGIDTEEVHVDTGFIVCNPPSYPNFLKFLAQPDIRIPTVPTEMTFSVSRDGGLFEWAGKDVSTVFCQMQNLLRPGMWRMIWDILRFNASALSLIDDEEPADPSVKASKAELSIGAYLDRGGYSNEFIDDYLIPMTAAIWSTPPDTCALDFPARTLIRFMYNHHLLQITGKPKWLTIPGGAHQYVNRVLSKLPTTQLHLSTPVQAISTSPNSSKVTVRLPSGTEEFDHVILATHSDTSLKMLQNGDGMTSAEEAILGSFEWNKNRTVLHADTNLMPKRRAAWSCWNYLTFSETNAQGEKRANANKVALLRPSNYVLFYIDCMNHLQHVCERKHGPVLVTLNPPFEPQPELVVARAQYEHPVVSAQSVRAQSELSSIQNVRGISYAGAWTKYGFHEDGFTSGLKAATSIPLKNLRVSIPFSITSPDRATESVVVRKIIERAIGTAERVRRLVIVMVWWMFGIVGSAGVNKSKKAE
ncbi:hypothetical protein FRC07_002136 [Ceratobasidium sp. 392]|nr:hypothetical protein FRC07_002136 [Ceratobasidium sp. 392]